MIVTLDTLTAGGQFDPGGGSGYVDAAGVEWTLTGLTGWFGTPAPATKRTARPTAPGMHRAAAYKGARTIVLGITATVTNQQSAPMRTAERAVAALCRDSALLYPLVVEDHLGKLLAYVELDGEILPTLRDGMDWSAVWSIPLAASDPRRFSPAWTASAAPTVVAASGGIDSTGAGIDSTGVGIDSGTSGTVPIAQAVATGTATNPVVLAVTGPASGFIVTEVETGRVLSYAGQLGPADTVLINTDSQPQYDVPGASGPVPGRGALLGTSNARVALSVFGGWPRLSPSTVRSYLLGGTYGVGASLTAYSRGAYE
ncbi:MAG: hypothetical protein JWO67_6962 [Streptosporangiaceae bacterium]|nr:hypothetical protein [Streptosporangiaceae bacterium]